MIARARSDPVIVLMTPIIWMSCDRTAYVMKMKERYDINEDC